MAIENKRFIVGIDLGTTNSAVSYVDLSQAPATNKGIKLFKVPQLTGLGEVSAMPVLPSFCYVPGKYDISDEAIQLPWISRDKKFVGVLARDHGAKIPARLVSSAKSWLCHTHADRRAKILPWGAGPEVDKISPVEATAAYLNHIRQAWNSTRGEEEELYLEHQLIIITVPASFDEVARDLTVEAANMAGLKQITLLEEPLAAFYSWLIGHEDKWRRFINPGELVLVCDVGGGTTDFTLITLRETEGSPRFERIAVGDHLILGGDNIDLALARHVEQKFSGQAKLSTDRWKTLCHLCRQAKENILDGRTDAETITMMGEGSSLISGTLSARLERPDLEQIVIEGFFPLKAPEERNGKPVRKGISEFGLPYEPEPAITRHIGEFLEKHRQDVHDLLGKRPFPDLILFNGGSLKSGIVQDRIIFAIRHWFSETDTKKPRVLANPAPDLAVALGASYYGLVKSGKGVRVGSGSARSYYLGFGRKNGSADTDPSAICIIERGLDEGTRIELPDKQFEVLTNQPVSFDLYSSSYRSGDRAGDLIAVDDTLTPLPPLQTVIQFGQKGVKTTIPVRIEAEFTEMGVLALWCASLSSPHRWRLQFQLRTQNGGIDIADTEIFESAVAADASAILDSAFSENADSSELTRLTKNLSKAVSRPREKWPLSFIRQMADELLARLPARRFSAVHEIRWFNLTGFCLRPGFGDGMDEQRVSSLWKIYRQGMIFKKNLQVNSEWWILWRRVAGGLTAGQQRQIIQDIRPLLIPKKGKVRLQAQEEIEIWMAVANMERLTVKDKIEFGRALVSALHPRKARPQQFWALSRIGARELLYGPVDRVIPQEEVSRWIEGILSIEWNNPGPVGQALLQMSRKTGDRVRDMEPETIERVLGWMNRHNLAKETRCLQEVVPLARQEENALFGESLPSGIILKE